MELNNLKNEVSNLRLTPAEKTAMKARIFGIPSVSPAPSQYFAYSFQFLHAKVLVPLSVVLVVFISGTTAAAAQGSLPGDILYPVKVSINEQVEVAFASTPVAKAQVQAKLAVRRVEEAEVLASQGELTATTSAQLAADFEVHAQAAEDLTEGVSAQDPDTGASLKADLGSSLAAHSAILATLGQDSAEAGDSSDKDQKSLATRVLARADTGRTIAAAKVIASIAPAAQTKLLVGFSAKMGASAATTTQDEASTSEQEREPVPADSAQEKASLWLKDRAQSALIGARKDFDDIHDDVDAATAAQVEAKFAQIDRLMVEGAQALEAHDYAQARAAFAEALGSSIKLSTLLVAQEKIQKNIITPVLKDRLIMNTDNGLSEGESVGL